MNTYDEYIGRCLTCRYWNGDREKQWEEIIERGRICMDVENGWPLDGKCVGHMPGSINPEKPGHYHPDANFGCIRWEEYDQTENKK